LRIHFQVLFVIAAIGAILWGFVVLARPPAGEWLLHVSYDPTRELYRAMNKAFVADYFERTGKCVAIRQSHSGSAGQARAVNEGLPADVVSLAIPPDLDSVARSGLVAPDWRDRLPHRSTPFYSTIVFVVRTGNPKRILDWTDLLRPDDGLQVVTPNPKTSGNGKLSLLAAWGAAIRRGNSKEEADLVVKALLAKAPVLDASARAATATFAQKQIGDVHLTFESEAVLEVRESGAALEIIYPASGSLRVEPPIALVDRNVERRGTKELSDEYLNFIFSPAGQRIGAELFYRPSDSAVAKEFEGRLPKVSMFSLGDVGIDWKIAMKRFFESGALVDQIAEDLAGVAR
jgi:sulfate/thiosulfate transport system substrate-binding protein